MNERRSGGSGIGWLLGAAAGAAAAYQITRRWPSWSLRGRVALVTGGTRGLGFLIARELLQQGVRVAICARDEEEVREAVESLQEHGRVHGITCDVTDADAVHAMVGEVMSVLGPIEIAINNAGQMMVGPVEHMQPRDFHHAMAVHFGGPLNVVHAVLPAMRQRRQGRIVNIASIGGLVPIPHMAPYVASKFALVGMSRAMYAELANQGIRMTVVCPGPLRTGSQLAATYKGRHEEEFAWFATSGTLPLMSSSALHAARRIVRAVRSGEPMVVIGWSSHLLRAFDGLMPGATSDMISMVDRYILPGSSGGSDQPRTGEESSEEMESSPLLSRIRRAADDLQ